MGGLLLFFFFGLWILLISWTAHTISRRAPAGPWRFGLLVFVWVVVAPSPISGELIASRQFAKLCESSKVRTDLSATRDRRVYLAEVQEAPVKSLFLSAKEERWRYVDAETGRPVVSFEAYRAKGGLFFGAIALSQGGSPFLFPEYCRPEGLDPSNYIRQLGLTRTDLVSLKKSEEKNDQPDQPAAASPAAAAQTP